MEKNVIVTEDFEGKEAEMREPIEHVTSVHETLDGLIKALMIGSEPDTIVEVLSPADDADSIVMKTDTERMKEAGLFEDHAIEIASSVSASIGRAYSGRDANGKIVLRITDWSLTIDDAVLRKYGDMPTNVAYDYIIIGLSTADFTGARVCGETLDLDEC